MADLLRSPLHDEHVALGAKLAPFGGWEMPIEYADGVLNLRLPKSEKAKPKQIEVKVA